MKIQFPKFLKAIILLSALTAGCIGIEKIYYHATGDFRLSNIRYEETVFKPKSFAVKHSDEKLAEIKKILTQEFQFLGKGNQSYAFLGKDNKTVLKFFKFGHLKRSWFENFLPENDFFKQKHRAQEKRFDKVFEGYMTAYTEDPENSALLFIHLNPSDNLNTKVTVKDKLGIDHTIDLDSVVFVVQEKVIPTRDLFSELLEKKDIEGVKTKIGSLFDLYLAQYKKGLFDRDHNLMYNTGFKGDAAIRLDVGKFRKEPLIKDPVVYKKDLEKIAFVRITRFMKKYYPKYEQEIRNDMKIKLDAIFNE